MSRNGNGVYTLPSSSPVVGGTIATADDRNEIDNDIATAITGSLAANGETVVTSDISLSNNKLTNLKAGVLVNDAARVDQVQTGVFSELISVSGTDTITASLSPSLAAYANAQQFLLSPASNNTGAVTININALGAKSLTKNGITALIADDLIAGASYNIAYDGTVFQIVGNISSDVDISAKADIASPAFTGNPTAPTQTTGNDSTRLATTAFVKSSIPTGLITASAWGFFNGTTSGTNAPTDGAGVSTVVRNGAGDYTINFSPALPHANYSATFGGYASSALIITENLTNPLRTTTQLRIMSVNYTSTLADMLKISFVVYA